MFFSSNNVSNQRRTNDISSLLRKFDIAEANVACVHIGRTAIDSALILENIIINREVPKTETDDSYLGTVEINHSDSTEVSQTTEEPGSVEQRDEDMETEERLQTVSNKYIPAKKHDNSNISPYDIRRMYPNESPLLAPN